MDSKELNKYKAKVERDKKKISELKEEIKGYKQLQQINDAMVAAILKAHEVTEESPLVITKEDIDNALSKMHVIGIYEDGVYRLHYKEEE